MKNILFRRTAQAIGLAFLLATGVANGQKIKYKDIFPDLEARKFNKIESSLASFLTDEKNADHPNANYQMGLIMEAKFLLQDIVVDTSALFIYGDTALSFYNKAVSLITEKELRKNDEYYQSFYRRDLRTGDFGIKISDVQLDIEKKIEAIESRIQSVRDFHQAVGELSALEEELIATFNALVASSKSYNDFLMRSELETITTLGDLQVSFRAFEEKAAATIAVGKDLEVADYFNSSNYRKIEQFTPLSAIFPLSNKTIESWNFLEWASQAKSALNKEVFVLKNDITDFDKGLTNATTLLKSGKSVKFSSELSDNIKQSIEKYDPNGIAQKLLTAKIKENTIRFLSDTLLNPAILDSSAIGYQVLISDSLVRELKDLKAALSFSDKALDDSEAYYSAYFSSAYQGKSGVRKYADRTMTWASSIQPGWDANRSFWQLRNNWGLTATDTIPLRPVTEDYSGSYATRGFLELVGDTIISWGVKTDSLLGFIAKFGPDRKMIWQNRFESKVLTELGDFDLQSDTLNSGASDVTFYLFDETPSSEVDIAIVNVEIDGNLNWQADATGTKKPVYTVYTTNTKETTIFFYPQEEYPLASGELGYVIINRNGEVR